jgi:hypothetical protein
VSKPDRRRLRRRDLAKEWALIDHGRRRQPTPAGRSRTRRSAKLTRTLGGPRQRRGVRPARSARGPRRGSAAAAAAAAGGLRGSATASTTSGSCAWPRTRCTSGLATTAASTSGRRAPRSGVTARSRPAGERRFADMLPMADGAAWPSLDAGRRRRRIRERFSASLDDVLLEEGESARARALREGTSNSRRSRASSRVKRVT